MTGRLPDPAFWQGRRVLLTGHTGFKGAWAALWMTRMGAQVTGFARAPDQSPALFDLADVGKGLEASVIADLADLAALRHCLETAAPDIVIHMAAQALVRRALADPVETFATNVMGTVEVLEALRADPPARAALVVTSDKVYANDSSGGAFAEDSQLGGRDPYSASKSACELAVAAWRESYFAGTGTRIATARGGNVIGGGDFSADRIVPDIVRAAIQSETLVLRHPRTTRPWQHVLDCVAGYLVYLEALAAGDDVPHALNFGPDPASRQTVSTLAEHIQTGLGVDAIHRHQPLETSIETTALAIDSRQAAETLGWRSRLDFEDAARWTADWYRDWRDGKDARTLTLFQIDRYMAVKTR